MKVDRLTRVNELLKRELAGLLERGLVVFPPKLLVSVTAVTASVDLRRARVLVSVFGGGPAEQREVFKALAGERVELQRRIARTLGFKHTPVLEFEPDDRMAAGDRVLELLREAESADDVE